MNIDKYDIISNMLWATINAYTFFVLVYSFNWSKRKYRQHTFTALYLLLCYALALARRFALFAFSTAIPMLSYWEPLFAFLDLFLLCYCFETSFWKSFILVLCHSIGYPLTFHITERTLHKLIHLPLLSGSTFHTRLKHEMTLLATSVLLFYICILLAASIKRSRQQPPMSPWSPIGMLLPSVLYIFGYMWIFPYMIGVENDAYPFLIGTIMFAINIAAWLLTVHLDQKNVQLYYQNQHYKEQALYFAALKKDNLSMQKRVHDERKHYTHMMGLLQQNEYARLESYLSSLNRGEFELHGVVITGNQDMDTVLNAKIAEARAADCEIQVRGQLPQQLEIDPVDSCILLGNCLDNAIHACRRTDSRTITVEFAYYRQLLLLQIRNAYLPVLERMIRADAKSEKKRTRSGGGIGLEIIDSVVRKYNGTMKTRYKKNIFTIEILMYVSSQKKACESTV